MHCKRGMMFYLDQPRLVGREAYKVLIRILPLAVFYIPLIMALANNSFYFYYYYSSIKSFNKHLIVIQAIGVLGL